MRTALVVAADGALRDRLVRSLDGCSVFTACSDEEAFRQLRFTEVELIVREAAVPMRDLRGFLERARQLCAAAVVVCILPADAASHEDEAVAEDADFVLLQPFTSRHLQGVLRQVDDKLRLTQEVSALRTLRKPVDAPGVAAQSPALDVPLDTLGRMVREFAKALSAGFDLGRVLDLFLDAVAELARPSRSAILVTDPAGQQYRIGAFRGLAPHVVESVSLRPDAGLPRWLAAEGRLIHIEEAQARAADPGARDVARELALLQAVVAIPLISHGELVAILTLGQRITGGAYSRREAEILFDLATRLGTAISDIRIHHLLQYEKQLNERILAHMAHGVITIGPDERVVIMNRRAEEILGVSARDVLHRDLRQLPTPLGDLLFETLTRGRTATREEIQLALRSLPLEVSTYRVMGDGATPIGAVLVFEDLTAHRQAARERREAEQLQLLTRIVARIADEIKNPLVSIRTFMELLEERYDDPGFRHQFAGVVGRDVRRLVEMFEKLAGLVNEGEYKLEPVDVRVVAEEFLAELGAQPAPAASAEACLLAFFDESTQKHVSATFSCEGRSFVTRGDRDMLKKALAYLVWYLLRKTPGQEAKVSVSLSHLDKEDRVRLTVASRTADVRPDELGRIFDPIQVVQQNLIDVGPCVSQRIVEAQGGRLQAKQGRSEVSFTAELPGAPS
ncbi:MAG: GAF domain-containing protein [Candidatus Rokubacteria bacterium]|nr:GAF domain-containing protein [Candidatus Rokubacteria bacterium]